MVIKSNQCVENDWLAPKPLDGGDNYSNYWTMTAYENGEESAWQVDGSDKKGDLISSIVLNYAYVYPTVYLNEDVRITGGTGAETDPLILEL